MEKSVKKAAAESVLIAFFAAVNIGFFVSIDFYIGNIDELLLPPKYVVTAIAITSVLTFAAVFLLDRLTAGRNNIVLQIINTLIFAVNAGFYIQGNFLSVNMGLMDGSKYSPGVLRIVLNTVFWCALLTGIVIFSRKKYDIYRKAVPYICAAIATIQVITAAVSYVLMYAYEIDTGLIGNWLYVKDTFVCSVTGMGTYSSNENFIIILADEYDSFSFDSAAEQCPEALEGFDGFTYYRNTVGKYGFTREAVDYIFLGAKGDAADSQISDDFFENLSKRFSIWIYAGPSHLFGRDIYEKYVVNYFPADFAAGDVIRTQKAMLKVTMFKCCPEILKNAFWFTNSDFSRIIGGTKDIRPYMPENLAFYNNIPTEMTLTDENCFKLIYISGLHDPLDITSDLQRVEHWGVSPEEQAIAVNKIIKKYFEFLKSSDVYDNSTIILLADHGLKGNGKGKYPLLMYKPANAESKGITVSDAPISHDDLYPTLIALSGGVPDGRTIFEIDEDEQRERSFFIFAGNNEIETVTGNIK